MYGKFEVKIRFKVEVMELLCGKGQNTKVVGEFKL